MKNILISVGPIPSRLDSVKFITNRFKGGLALKTAEFLKSKGNNVTIIAWNFTDLSTEIPIIRVSDVVDYYNYIINSKFDAYILAAAVANLMPSNPFEGKFPSHNYKVGDKFNIEFEIAPRIIDKIKEVNPKSTLIGYKLFDGDDNSLIEAAKITLKESKANIVFANHPLWSKERKIVLTQDGSIFNCSFDEHCFLIHKIINESFYSTEVVNNDYFYELNDDDLYILNTYPVNIKENIIYGTFAIKKENGFITTARGKNSKNNLSFVFSVDHEKLSVSANKKATLNAPLLDLFLKKNPKFKIVIHGHDLSGDIVHDNYEFPGTVGDLSYAKEVVSGQKILLNHHGFIVGFNDIEEYKNYY